MSFIDNFHKNVDGNAVCGVICSQTLTVIEVVELLKARYNRVWCGMSDKVRAQNVFSLMESQNNASFTDNPSYESATEGVVVSSTGVLKDKILSSFASDTVKHIEFTDVLVLDGVTPGALDTVAIMALWSRSYNMAQGNRIPRLVLLLDSMEVPENIPLDVPYVYKDTPDPKVVYAGEQDIIELVKLRNGTDNTTRDYVVYCEDEQRCADITKRISGRRLPNAKVYRIGKNSPSSKFVEINAANADKRKIIVTMESLLIHPDCIVFDNLRFKLRGETRFISKTLAHTRALHSAECVRLCDEAVFDSEVTVHNTTEYKVFPPVELLAQVLEVGIDPVELFSGFIEQEIIEQGIADMKKHSMISNTNQVLKAGNLFLATPLSHRPSAVLHRAIEESYPLFPFVVLAVFIEMGETQFFVEAPEFINHRSMLTSHLVFWSKFADEVQTLKPGKRVLNEWCGRNSLDVDAVSSLCSTVVVTFNAVETMYKQNFIIGKFSVENLMKAAKPLIQEVYRDDIHFLSADNRHYADTSDRRFLLPETLTNPPFRVIVLTKTHNRITSLIADDDMLFSEHKVMRPRTPPADAYESDDDEMPDLVPNFGDEE